jgi:hypothetical protein
MNTFLGIDIPQMNFKGKNYFAGEWILNGLMLQRMQHYTPI